MSIVFTLAIGLPLLIAFGLMVVVHVWGFLKRAQPWTETAEIPLYLVLAIGAAGFRFGWLR